MIDEHAQIVDGLPRHFVVMQQPIAEHAVAVEWEEGLGPRPLVRKGEEQDVMAEPVPQFWDGPTTPGSGPIREPYARNDRHRCLVR